ncbi:MAG: hypothetical protein L6R37_001021 [Teloschistes peruensis]|nr:MAG: hypothetical protein L6R37_001021 [Teloschistes peruensis]
MASANTAPSKTKKAVTKNAASTKSNKSTKATKATLGKAKAKTTATPIFPNLAGGTIAAPTAAGNSAPAASSGTAAAATNKAPSKRKKLLHQSSSDSEDSDNEAPPPKRTKKAAGKEIATKAKGKTPATKQASKKRRANDEEDGTEASEAPAAKKFKVARDEKAVKATKAKPAPKAKPKVVINNAPTDRLNVYVFGEGSSGELGLGTAKNAIDVKRPRLNAFLSAEKVGVVQIACGGMHVAALTHDGKVMTWGVNDQGALGRDTNWEGGLRDVGESDSESDSGSDSGLNPRESTPTAVTTFPPCVVIVKLCAGDSHTLALTDDGQVYGWGTFRNNEGILGFIKDTYVQYTPILLPNLKNIVDITSGSNHALALDKKGVVHTWGSGQQNQLGFRMMERKRYDSLTPSPLRLRGKNIRYIACGADHSFVIDGREKVWSWGANSFGATGIYEGMGEDNAVIISPSVVDSLNLTNDTIAHMDAGTHHSIASTTSGRCLVWGRFDGSQTGIDAATIPNSDIVRDSKGAARILTKPTQVPGIKNCTFVAAGSDHTLAITDNGKGYSWGFSANYQTGQGTDDDVTVATMFNNTAVREKKLNWAGAGGQYSILTSVAEIDPVSDNGNEEDSSAAIMSGAL